MCKTFKYILHRLPYLLQFRTGHQVVYAKKRTSDFSKHHTMSVVLTLCVFAILGFDWSSSSHFRGATIMWEPDSSGTAIQIHFRISWRKTFSIDYNCNDLTISRRTLIGTDNMTCFSGCTGSVGSLMFLCTDYNDKEDWTTGRNTITYKPDRADFTFGYTGGAWISTLVYGSDSNWSLQATVNMTRRSETGRINRSPTVDMAPIVVLIAGCKYTIQLPVGDVDGDIVRCRWATTFKECGGICNATPEAYINQTACTISFTPLKSGYYAVAVQVEDFSSRMSTTPLSSIPLQFLLHVPPCDRCTCDSAPQFVPPTPASDECYSIDVGNQFQLSIRARSRYSLRGFTTMTALGMKHSVATKSSDGTFHYMSMNVTWTPSVDDGGRDHSLCFYATDDNNGLSSTIQCVRIAVSVRGPMPVRAERVGCSNSWILVFDQLFQRPKSSVFIEVYQTSIGKLVERFDVTTSKNVVYDENNRRMNITLSYTYNIDTDYHVNVPSGLVQGYVSCGARSVAITNTSFWQIQLDCGMLTLVNGSVVAPNGTSYPKSVTLRCDRGFDLIGNNVRQCQANRTWSGQSVYCRIKDCGPLNLPNNGRITVSATTYMGLATFSCNSGSDMVGSKTLVCTENGTWNGTQPICRIKGACGPLNKPANGNVTVISASYLGLSVFTCDVGYRLVGSKSLVCQADGTWNGTVPICTIIDCGPLYHPINGRMTVIATTYMGLSTFSCNAGYDIVGSKNLVCKADGNWNDTIPTCKIKVCGPLKQPTNGRMAVNASTYLGLSVFSCDDGFDLIGSGSLICQADGAWNGTEPTCRIKDCGSLRKPANGNVTILSTTVLGLSIFTCDAGYRLVGSKSLVCKADGTWNGTVPICRIIECGPLQQPTNGQMAVNASTYLGISVFSCDQGFDLIGSGSLICQADGTWNGKEPTCRIKDCGNVPAPTNGFVYQPLTTYGSYALFLCNEGYEIVPTCIPPVRLCQANGTWGSATPRCEIAECCSLPAPKHGFVVYNSTVYGATASVFCESGYVLNGPKTVTCKQDKQWSFASHSCQNQDPGK